MFHKENTDKFTALKLIRKQMRIGNSQDDEH